MEHESYSYSDLKTISDRIGDAIGPVSSVVGSKLKMWSKPTDLDPHIVCRNALKDSKEMLSKMMEATIAGIPLPVMHSVSGFNSSTLSFL